MDGLLNGASLLSGAALLDGAALVVDEQANTVVDERAKLATARLGAPYGVRGFQAVRTYSGDTEHLFRLAEVELRESRSGRLRTAAVAAVRRLGDKVVMRLRGVTTPEQAREFSGWELWVPTANTMPPTCAAAPCCTAGGRSAR